MASRSYSVKENPLNHYSVEDQGVVKKKGFSLIRVFSKEIIKKYSQNKTFNLQQEIIKKYHLSKFPIFGISDFFGKIFNLQQEIIKKYSLMKCPIFAIRFFCRYCLENTNIIIKTHLSRKIHSTIISTTIPYFAIIVWIFLDEPGGRSLPPLRFGQ